MPTAKPFSVIAAQDANGDGRDELFVSMTSVSRGVMGRGVVVAAFVECEMRLLHNVDGEPYVFLVGKWDGTLRGVGCVDVRGTRRLVGLKGRPDGDDAVSWSRTIVEFTRDQARNGPTDEGTYTRGEDDDAIALLGDATCGQNPLDAEFSG